MQYKWLNKQNNKNLIVFFNGWGMDENIVNNLDSENYDVLTFFDYRTFEVPNIDFSKYEKKYLIAWSMGVFVCNYFYEKLEKFNRYIAINGTLKPIDDDFGIPIKAYNLTIDNFNELTCSKFMKKISSVIDLKNYCTRNIEELKQELIAIRDLQLNKFFNFNKAIISKNDRIFPYKNMLSFWENTNASITELDASHYIFDKYNKWSDLI